jgi:hypothetical protein
LHHAGGLGLRQGRLRLHIGTALDDRAMEQAARQRRHQVDECAQPARRFPEHRHLLRIAAERADVLPHPFQRGLLIQESVIARRVIGGLGRQRRMGEESERPEPVVDGHDDGVALHELGRVELVALADRQRAAMNPHHHRAPVEIMIDALVGAIHVEEQAVLGQRRVAEGRERLRTMIAEPRRVLRDDRTRHRLRRLPALIELPDGAGRVELALEDTVRRHHQRGVGERALDRRCQCEGEAEQQRPAQRAPQPRSRGFLRLLNGSKSCCEHDVSSS